MLQYIFASLVVNALAQCGPDGTRPYPPGMSDCPTSEMAHGMTPHTAGTLGDNIDYTDGNPHPISSLGNVAITSVAGNDYYTGTAIPIHESVYSPFENGFSSSQTVQRTILEELGCVFDGEGKMNGEYLEIPAGIDTRTAEKIIAFQCNATIPRVENGVYISLLDSCGGHTNEYHFHEKLSCLYPLSGDHSIKVADALDGKSVYGRYEDFSQELLPTLDACNGHFGPVPDSVGSPYHYHITSEAPFVVGCYGPSASGELVTTEVCRNISKTCGDNDNIIITTAEGRFNYDPFCPCYYSAGDEGQVTGTNTFQSCTEAYKVCDDNSIVRTALPNCIFEVCGATTETPLSSCYVGVRSVENNVECSDSTRNCYPGCTPKQNGLCPILRRDSDPEFWDFNEDVLFNIAQDPANCLPLRTPYLNLCYEGVQTTENLAQCSSSTNPCYPGCWEKTNGTCPVVSSQNNYDWFNTPSVQFTLQKHILQDVTRCLPLYSLNSSMLEYFETGGTITIQNVEDTTTTSDDNKLSTTSLLGIVLGGIFILAVVGLIAYGNMTRAATEFKKSGSQLKTKNNWGTGVRMRGVAV